MRKERRVRRAQREAGGDRVVPPWLSGAGSGAGVKRRGRARPYRWNGYRECGGHIKANGAMCKGRCVGASKK